VYSERAELKIKLEIVFLHITDAEENANGLGDNRCQRRAKGVPVKNRDKKKIQKYIGDAGGQNKIKGLPGIAHAPEYRGKGVVTKNKNNSRKGYRQIAVAFQKRLSRRMNKVQYRSS